MRDVATQTRTNCHPSPALPQTSPRTPPRRRRLRDPTLGICMHSNTPAAARRPTVQSARTASRQTRRQTNTKTDVARNNANCKSQRRRRHFLLQGRKPAKEVSAAPTSPQRLPTKRLERETFRWEDGTPLLGPPPPWGSLWRRRLQRGPLLRLTQRRV